MVEPAFACRLHRCHNQPALLDSEFGLIRNFASREQWRGNQYAKGITNFAQVGFCGNDTDVITMYALCGAWALGQEQVLVEESATTVFAGATCC